MRRALSLLAFVLACSRPPLDPRAGNVRMQLASRASASTAAVCADFTLAPFALTAAGAQAAAGAPFTIAGGQLSTPILGCIDTPGLAPDWRYLVTATNFVDCATHQPIPGASPAVQTFTVDVDCVAGRDTGAQVTAEISIPQANDAGYIDVSVGVSAHEQLTGCKQADVDAAGVLHFGLSATTAQGQLPPSAFTGVGQGAALAAASLGSVQQFAGQVSAGAELDTYFTGLFALPTPADAEVVQAPIGLGCASDQLSAIASGPLCVTRVTGGVPQTQAWLADVIEELPGMGLLAGGVVDAGHVRVLWSAAAPGAPNLSTLSHSGYDGLTADSVLSLPAGFTALGLYASHAHAPELLLLALGASGPAVLALAPDPATGAFTFGPPAGLATLSLAQQQAMGLFAGSGCLPLPTPACPPGPDTASSCTPSPAPLEVDTVQGPVAQESNSGCTGATYAPDFYYQFEAGATHDDSSGANRDLAGGALPAVAGGAVGQYLHYQNQSYTQTQFTSPIPASAAATVELLMRFDPDAFATAPIVSAPDSYPFMIQGFLFSVLPTLTSSYLEISYSYTDTDPDGSNPTQESPRASFLMNGAAGRSWESLNDGAFHHFAFTFDLAAGLVQLRVDGKLEDGWTAAIPAPAAGRVHEAFVPLNRAWFSYHQNGQGLQGDLDEVAYSSVALPATLIAQHAAEAQAGQHYTWTDRCTQPPPVPPSDDPRSIMTDYAPTFSGTLPVSPWTHVGTLAVPTQLVSEQLRGWSLPRYRQGHTLPLMDSWLNPAYFGWLPDPATGLMTLDLGHEKREGTKELVRHWGYHAYMDRSVDAWNVVAGEAPHTLSYQTFWGTRFDGPVPADQLLPDGRLALSAVGWSAAAGAHKAAQLLASIPAALAGLTPLANDLLVVEDGETNPLAAYNYADLDNSVDFAFYQANFDPGLTCAPAGTAANCAPLKAYSNYAIALFRQAYFDGIRNALPAAQFPSVRFTWYFVDGNGAYQLVDWQDGGRLVTEEQPGQLFQPAGTTQHLSTTNEYIDSPARWMLQDFNADQRLAWLDITRSREEATGDFLTGPFVSAGYVGDAPQTDVRPPQMLSLLKYMVTAGSVTFHPFVLATVCDNAGTPWPRDYPCKRGDAREYIWDAAMASYAQALASRVEPLMRSSRIVWETNFRGRRQIRHEAGGPERLVGVRQVQDAAGSPQQHFLISTAVEGLANGVSGQWRRSADVSFSLTAGGPRMTLPARRQGNLWDVDLTGPAPVVKRLDLWHEDAHFSYWWKGFRYAAEVDDGLLPGALGESLQAATEAPGMAALDFTGLESFLRVQAGSARTWTFAQAAQAPAAQYAFEPREAWNTSTWYVWIKARNTGPGPAPLFVSVDGRPGEAPTQAVGCVSGSAWQWVRTDVRAGQPASLGGLAPGAHTLFVAPGSTALQIAEIKLAPEADHQECPVAPSCACGG